MARRARSAGCCRGDRCRAPTRASRTARPRSPRRGPRRASGAAVPTRARGPISANAQTPKPAAICPHIGDRRSSANATASTARPAVASRRSPVRASSSRVRISGTALAARGPVRSRASPGAARLDDVELRVGVALLAHRAVAKALGRDHDRPVTEPGEQADEPAAGDHGEHEEELQPGRAEAHLLQQRGHDDHAEEAGDEVGVALDELALVPLLEAALADVVGEFHVGTARARRSRGVYARIRRRMRRFTGAQVSGVPPPPARDRTAARAGAARGRSRSSRTSRRGRGRPGCGRCAAPGCA